VAAIAARFRMCRFCNIFLLPVQVKRVGEDDLGEWGRLQYPSRGVVSLRPVCGTPLASRTVTHSPLGCQIARPGVFRRSECREATFYNAARIIAGATATLPKA
jgi:hypothetical protein